MLRLATDENFDNRILRGLLLRLPDLDLTRIQDAGLAGKDDPAVLEWAASEGRILLTHDVATVTNFAYQRVEQGLSMPGVVEVRLTAAIGVVIDDLELLIETSEEHEWDGQVLYVPF